MNRKKLMVLGIVGVMIVSCLSVRADDRGQSQFLFPPRKTDGVFPRHYRPARTIDCLHLKLDIKVIMSESRVEATAHYQFEPIHDSVKEIHFDAIEMEIEKVNCNASAELDWTYADNKLHITFEDSLPIDKTYNLSITYKATPEGGMYFTDSKHVAPQSPDQLYTLNEDTWGSHWIPCVDYPNDRMVTEMVATVPKEFTTLSNGLLVESTIEGDWKTDHWKQEIPHVIYLVSLVVGKFDIVKDEWNGIPVEYYVEEGLAGDARPSMGKTPAMIEFFSDYFGYEYPYEKYAQVAVRYFRAGGMEHTTATTLFEWAVIDETARLDTDYDGLIAHELAHQWFGDLVTCESWPQLWLNEGFATLSDALWFEHEKGEDAYLEAISGKMESYINSSRRYTRPIVTNTFDNPWEMFDSHSYPKGASVLHMLRQQLGDELFRKSLKLYLHQNAVGLVDTDDLMEAIEEATGKPMDRFFEQWVFSAGHPKVEVKHEWLPKTKQVKLRIQQTQEMEEGAPAFAFPLEIEVATEDETILESFDMSKKDETVFIDCPKAPKRINVDPSIKVLMELTHKKSQDMLLEDLRNGSTIIVRIRAAREFDDDDDDRVIDALEHTLNHDSYWKVQQTAAQSLGKIHNEKTRKILMKASHHPHPNVRREVIEQLGKYYKDEEIYAILVERFKEDESIHVVTAAVNGLSNLKLEKAAAVLLPGLQRESHRNKIRTAVMNALVDFEEPKVYSSLVKYSKDPNPRGVRHTAIRGLGRLVDKIEKHQDKTRELLLDYLESESDSIKRAAISALQDLKDEKAIPQLRRVANDDSEEGIRNQADGAIQEIRKEEVPDLAGKNSRRIDELEDENKKLEERLEKLEKALELLKKDDNNDESENDEQ